jgi:pimeloyl-ACP methyl ester carboxylesterase
MNQQRPVAAFSTCPVDADENPEQFYRQAHWLALCSLHVYPPKDDPKEDKDTITDRLKGSFPSWGLDWDLFEYILNESSTQCFVAGNADVIVVCFRGTENSPWDFLHDLVAIQVRDGDNIEGRAHLGFINALQQAWDQKGGLAEGEGLVAALKRHRTNQKVWFTGHSLGGAIAELAAARLIKQQILSSDDVAGIVTFGQPRVGNSTFARAYDDTYGLKMRHVRFVNNMDGVTLSPLPFSVWKFPPYRHVGRVAFINRAEEIRVNAVFGQMLLWRCGSWLQGLSRGPRSHEKSVGLVSRVCPLGSDHSMLGYEGALAQKVAKL